MKGVFESRPTLPRYHVIWEADIVLEYLKELSPNSGISLIELNHKLAMLLALVTAQRTQSLKSIDLNELIIDNSKCVIIFNKILKQTTSKTHLSPITILRYSDSRLCVVECLEEYIKRTKTLRSASQLFISALKPHKAVTTASIGKWIKKTLFEAGLDISMFKAHSTRAAATSAAKNAGINANIIMKTAGWTSSSTFAKFYDKPVTSAEFSLGVLTSGQNRRKL